MRLRLLATAVLWNGNDLLMMKRSPHRTLSPGMWAGIGGHIEPNELADPQATCLREIEEETGLQVSEISNLTLRYVLLRRSENEIRQQFVFFGETTTRTLSDTDEGTLHWIPSEQVLDREIPFTFRSMLEHYFHYEPASYPWIGTIGLSLTTEHIPHVIWAPLLDPLVK